MRVARTYLFKGQFSAKIRQPETNSTLLILADNRYLQSAGLSLAFSRLSQSVFVVIVRESAVMLIGRDAKNSRFETRASLWILISSSLMNVTQ